MKDSKDRNINLTLSEDSKLPEVDSSHPFSVQKDQTYWPPPTHGYFEAGWSEKSELSEVNYA